MPLLLRLTINIRALVRTFLLMETHNLTGNRRHFDAKQMCANTCKSKLRFNKKTLQPIPSQPFGSRIAWHQFHLIAEQKRFQSLT